jgi:hypothetical protein
LEGQADVGREFRAVQPAQGAEDALDASTPGHRAKVSDPPPDKPSTTCLLPEWRPAHTRPRAAAELRFTTRLLGRFFGGSSSGPGLTAADRSSPGSATTPASASLSALPAASLRRAMPGSSWTGVSWVAPASGSQSWVAPAPASLSAACGGPL